MTSPLGGLSGGSTSINNSNNKSKAKDKKIKEHFVYHYSTGIPTLAEQIVIENKSVFLQIDNRGKPVISSHLDLSEDQGIMVYPNEDGISGVASYITPIKFDGLNEIKHYIEQAKKETIKSIFDKHLLIWKRFVASSDEHMRTFLAMDSVYSHFQDLFEATHYDLIVGPAGSGKGAILTTFKLLGYRVVLAGDLSGAGIIDLYGSAEPCQITIAEDELDDIEYDHVKRKIYKIGYDLTGNTTRTLDGNTSNRANKLYQIFGFKVFGTESPPEDKAFEGFNDRSFTFQSTKGKAKYRVKKVLLEMSKPLYRRDPKYNAIIEEVEDVRRRTFIFRMLHQADIIEDVETNIDGRPLELTGAQINLFATEKLGSDYWSVAKEERNNTLLEKTILPTLSEFLRRKGQLAEKTIEGVIYEGLKNIMDKESTEDFTVAYENIYGQIRDLTDATDSTMPNEHAIYSVEYGKITHRTIISKCRRVFQGKDDQIHMTIRGAEGEGVKQIHLKALRFDKSAVDQQGKAYEIIDSIKIVDDPSDLDSDSGSEYTNTLKKPRRRNTSKNKEKEQSDGQTNGQSDPYNNNASTNANVDNTQDSISSVKNITTQEEGLKPVDNDNTEDVTYTRTSLNSVYQCTQESKAKKRKPGKQDSDCDLRTQEGADRFRAKVEELGKKRKSKSNVADMAAANLSGDGVMFGDKKESETDPGLYAGPMRGGVK